MGSKVLVTGGSGFIGSYVVDRLLRDGKQVMVFDHSAPGLVTREKTEAGVEFFHGNIMDDVAVTEAAAHVDGIIHLSAVLGTQETIQNPRPAALTNIVGSLNVLEAAVQYDLPVAYAGVGNHWMREHGAGTYTITKTAVEDFIRMYNQFRGGRISVARPVNAYGPRQSVAAPFGSSKVRKIMPSFICRALTGNSIEVYGDGTQISDCVYVSDVADVFVETLNHTAEHGGAPKAFEVGPALSVDVNAIASAVALHVARVTGEPEVDIVHLPMRPGEVPNAVVSADQSTLADLTNIDPRKFVGLEDGIRQTVEWFHENWLPTFKA